jgi:hypothetical protein
MVVPLFRASTEGTPRPYLPHGEQRARHALSFSSTAATEGPTALLPAPPAPATWHGPTLHEAAHDAASSASPAPADEPGPLDGLAPIHSPTEDIFDDVALSGPIPAHHPSEDHVERLDAALRQLEDAQERLMQQARVEVVELALQIARHVTTQNVARDDHDLGPVVDDALRQLGDALSIVVRVGPRHHAALSASHGQGRRLQVVLDPSLRDGDIVVDSDNGTVDARLESRLDAVARAVRASVGQP